VEGEVGVLRAAEEVLWLRSRVTHGKSRPWVWRESVKGFERGVAAVGGETAVAGGGDDDDSEARGMMVERLPWPWAVAAGGGEVEDVVSTPLGRESGDEDESMRRRLRVVVVVDGGAGEEIE